MPLLPALGGSGALLRDLMRTRDVDAADRQPLFRDRSSHPWARFGVRHILHKHAGTASHSVPTLASKRVHPYEQRLYSALRSIPS